MKNLKQYIEEKLIVNKNYDPFKYHPKTWNELREIVEERFEELGPGTKTNPIDFNDIDISGITSFYNNKEKTGLFELTEFEYIDISDWNVSNVENMMSMFFECHNLQSIGDLSKWDVSRVENVGFMFNGCIKLKSLGDLSNWNVSNVQNMYYTFNECTKLKSIGDVSNWNVLSVKDMRRMFDGSGITNIPDWYKG